jgi:Uma2 family endonuclease
MPGAERRTQETAAAELWLVPSRLYRLSVEQYHRIAEAGILTSNDRVELLNGYLIKKMSQDPPHSGAITRINRRLVRILPDEWIVQVQGPVTLRDSEPEPDFAIVRGPDGSYAARHPLPPDVAILVEVADSSLLQDRREKGPMYAQARIPEYWIVNLVESRIEVYTQPRAGKSPAYRQQQNYGPEESIPLILAGQEIARIPVRELLPPREVRSWPR